jgi:hypothetical protein
MISKLPLILIAAVLTSVPLCAQNPDLATAISNNFTVNAGPPATMTPISGTFRDKAKAVYDYMSSLSYTGNPPVDTVVNGVDVRWGTGTVSWSQSRCIVLATSVGATTDAEG